MSQILQRYRNPLVMNIGTGVPAYVWAGVPFTAGGSIATTALGVISHYWQGLPFTSEGRIAVAVDGLIANPPFTAEGYLSITRAEGGTSDLWCPNGSSFITAPTLGDITTSKVRSFIEGVVWDTSTATAYILSQAGTTLATREYGIFNSAGSLQCVLGGTVNTILTAGEVTAEFGSSVYTGVLDFEIDYTTGAFTLIGDSGVIKTGTMTVGAGRVAGMLLRIGARGSADDNSIPSSEILPSGVKVGNTIIFVDDVLVRGYDMPVSGVLVPDRIDSL